MSVPSETFKPNTEDRPPHLNQALKLDPELEEAWLVRELLKARESEDMPELQLSRALLVSFCSDDPRACAG